MSKTEEEASRRANIKKSYLGEPVDTKGQVEQRDAMRKQELQTKRELDLQERREMERKAKEADEKEKMEQLIKRQKLAQMTEADRRAKQSART